MSKKILVVDDQEIVRDFIKDVGETMGEDVETAENGDVAVSICKEHHIDLVFMDMRMPRKNGLETCKEILDLDPTAKVIVMTGFSEEEMMDEALESGAIAKIYKPFDINTVIELIRSAHGDGPGGHSGEDGGRDTFYC